MPWQEKHKSNSTFPPSTLSNALRSKAARQDGQVVVGLVAIVKS
jgi:hypothetical protein